MIQPLDSARNNWRLLWLDLEDPVPLRGTPRTDAVSSYYLPTCLLVTTASGKPLCPPELMEELDQPKTEQLLGRLFDEHGTPDRLTIAESDDWDTESWRSFGADCHLEISFGSLPSIRPEELRQVGHRIAQRLRGESHHPPDLVARGLVDSARRIKSQAKRAALLRKAIEQDSGCILARIELADSDYQAGRWNECRRAYQDVIEREERRWRGESPDWWEEPETRPYLRALYGRAMTEWHGGRFAETAGDLSKILTLNPRDNQGVRFLIPLVYLLGEEEQKALESLREFDSAYPGDYCEPSLLFGKGLALWKSGDEEGAFAAYRAGMLKNLHIAPLLLDLPLPPADVWHPNDRSEFSYAQDFIQSYAVLWDRDAAALRFLGEAHDTLGETVSQIIALRRTMSEWQDQRYLKDFKAMWKEFTDLEESLTGGKDGEQASGNR
jgi:tetratricopeptide (TPR) repeat protein